MTSRDARPAMPRLGPAPGSQIRLAASTGRAAVLGCLGPAGARAPRRPIDPPRPRSRMTPPARRPGLPTTPLGPPAAALAAGVVADRALDPWGTATWAAVAL